MLAIALVAVAWAARDIVIPGVGERSPFLAFGLAVLATALIAGFGPGLLASLLSSAIATFFYVTPRNTLHIEEPHDILGLTLFILEGLVAATAGGIVHRSLTRERAAFSGADRIARFLHHAESARRPPSPDRPPPIEALSDRELQVARLLARGFANDEIASALYVSRNTVKSHLKNVYGKLGVGTRTEAVARILELGLLKGPDG